MSSSSRSATSSHQGSTSAPNAAAVTARLGQELMGLMMASPPGVTAFPIDDSNIYQWCGRIEGADGTVYEGKTFKIQLDFPPTYPYNAPTVRFTTPCFHPNVDLNGGHICLDILKEEWSSVLSVQTVLTSLRSLLGDPNNASPLNPQAADLWDSPEQFKSLLDRYYQPLD